MSGNTIADDFNEAHHVLVNYISDKNNFLCIERAGNAISRAFENGNKLIACGNGGSMTDAMHLAEELSGKFRNNRPSLPAMAVSDPSYLTCTANDFGFDVVFSRFVEGFGKTGDVLFAISTSGNSANVLKAAETARSKGMLVIGLTGKTGGKLAPLCDIEIRVPHQGYSDRIQEIHILVIHSIVNEIERKMKFSPEP